MADNLEILIEKTLEEIMSENYGRYAKNIIQERALPDVRDGLKPVQRRIIYALNELQLFFDKPHKKSARLVGEVMGKYHPHGDSSIYEAMVRMSQDWKNNLKLVDIHGNNGSIDGDDPAAMRYTECRFSKYGEMTIADIEKNAVDFIPNYDGLEKEPVVLPTLLPNLLINGCSGIAAGYATNIPPFNPAEVFNALIARIDSPNCRLETIQNILPAPDFPTGGIILDVENIKAIYETGRGKIAIRSKIDLVNQKTAYITEIPYDVNKAELLKELHALILKNKNLDIISIVDETDDNGISIAINMKNAKNWEFVKNFLYKNSQLQINYNFNMVAIKDKKPYQMGILFMIDAFLEHVQTTVIRMAQYDLDRSLIRKEIIEGLIKAVSMIDEIIKLIRSSKDRSSAIDSLVNELSFTKLQAEAIVNLRLYRLSNTDVNDLEIELKNIIEVIATFEKIINDKVYRDNHLKAKFKEFKKMFNYARKSTLSHNVSDIKIDHTEIIEKKDVVIFASYDGYVKCFTKRTFNGNSMVDLVLKEDDIPVCNFYSNTKEKAVFITNKGNYISIPTYKIPENVWKDIGTHLNNLVEITAEEKIIGGFNFNEATDNNKILLIATKNSKIKRIKLEDLNITNLIKTSSAINLDDNDCVVAIDIANEKEETNVICVSKNGTALFYNANEIPLVGKNAGGVKNVTLRENDEIVSSCFDNKNKIFLVVVTKDGGKRIYKNIIKQGKRGFASAPIIAQTKDMKFKILNAFLVNQSDLIYVDGVNVDGFIKVSEFPIGNSETRISILKGRNFIKVSYIDNLKHKEKNDSNSDENDVEEEETIEEKGLFE